MLAAARPPLTPGLLFLSWWRVGSQASWVAASSPRREGLSTGSPKAEGACAPGATASRCFSGGGARAAQPLQSLPVAGGGVCLGEAVPPWSAFRLFLARPALHTHRCTFSMRAAVGGQRACKHFYALPTVRPPSTPAFQPRLVLGVYVQKPCAPSPSTSPHTCLSKSRPLNTHYLPTQPKVTAGSLALQRNVCACDQITPTATPQLDTLQDDLAAQDQCWVHTCSWLPIPDTGASAPGSWCRVSTAQKLEDQAGTARCGGSETCRRDVENRSDEARAKAAGGGLAEAELDKNRCHTGSAGSRSRNQPVQVPRERAQNLPAAVPALSHPHHGSSREVHPCNLCAVQREEPGPTTLPGTQAVTTPDIPLAQFWERNMAPRASPGSVPRRLWIRREAETPVCWTQEALASSLCRGPHP